MSLQKPAKSGNFSSFMATTAVKQKVADVIGGERGQSFITHIVSAVSTNPQLAACEHSTYLEPLEEKEGYKVKFNGEKWIYEEIPQTPEPTIEDLKAKKREEINQARDAAEQGGFEYMGKIFDSDQVSCQRISTAAQAMSLMPASDENKITWTCQDNSTIELTAAELSGLVVALAAWSNTCHQRATKLKAQIEAAKTAEELEKITWDDNPSTL